MLAQHSPASVLRLRNVLLHAAPCASAAQWRDTPAVETLPSTLLIGHFHYLGYLRSFLARCRLLAVWGEGKSCWSKVDLVKFPGRQAPLWAGSGHLPRTRGHPAPRPDLPWPAVVMGRRPSGEGEETEAGINLGKARCKVRMLDQRGPWWDSVVPETQRFWKAAEPA